ncbi:MAG: ABC transporter permease, partial [Candidatus Aminicenantes bacterium]|nr:ABC transporter permease [Candidatus Aminicenantes bacterium]
EIDKKTITTLMSKPLRRFEFLLGKFLGLSLTLLVMFALMTVFFQAYLLLLGGGLNARVFLAALYIFLEMVLLTSVAILFSTFSTPILASLFSLSFFLIGHFSRGLQTLISKVPPGFSRTGLRMLYLVLPDLENFNFKTEVVHGLPLPAPLLLNSAAYGLFYTLLILALAVAVFRRRDFI